MLDQDIDTNCWERELSLFLLNAYSTISQNRLTAFLYLCRLELPLISYNNNYHVIAFELCRTGSFSPILNLALVKKGKHNISEKKENSTKQKGANGFNRVSNFYQS